MTDATEQKALALVREVEDERGTTSSPGINRVSNNHEALCRAIEEFEAYKREVSDALLDKEEFLSLETRAEIKHHLSRFILPAPVDPLVEAFDAVWPGIDRTMVGALREALTKRGYEIREKADD